MITRRNRTAEKMASWVKARDFPGREYRVAVKLAASVRTAPDRIVEAKIVDLSANGFRLVAKEPLEPGQRITLIGRKTDGEAEIRWADELEAGGVFVGRGPALRHSI